jgi:hypothetical protein
MAAHQVIVPVQTEYLALRGLSQLQRIIQKVQKKGNPVLEVKILRTMHISRTVHSTEVVAELKQVFGAKLYETVIKRTIKFAEASRAGKPLLQFARDSEGAQAYRQLAQEVLADAQRPPGKGREVDIFLGEGDTPQVKKRRTPKGPRADVLLGAEISTPQPSILPRQKRPPLLSPTTMAAALDQACLIWRPPMAISTGPTCS